MERWSSKVQKCSQVRKFNFWNLKIRSSSSAQIFICNQVQDMEADRALLVQECEDRNQEVERLREKLGETAEEEEDGEDWELFDDDETF